MRVSWVEMAGVSHDYQQVIDKRLNGNEKALDHR
jgi:hypothetical protein